MNQQKKCLKFFLLLFVVFSHAQEIEKSIFITANTWDTSNTAVLAQIASDAEKIENHMLLVLGNAAPKNEIKNSIERQLKLIESFEDNVIFIPGSQEWSKHGFNGVEGVEKYIQKTSQAKFYPGNNEPIKSRDLSENIVLITVDSQWFLEDWNKHIYINDDSEIKNRTLFFLEFENQIKKAQGKIKIVAIHHPILTKTRQNFIAKTGGTSVQDFENKQFRKLRNRLKTVAQKTENVIFVSGNDRNLQYLNQKVTQIISGAAGKTEKVKKADEGNFTSSKNGYSRLDIDTDGNATVYFFATKDGVSNTIFQKTIFKGDKKNEKINYELKDTFPKTKLASIYTKDATNKNGFYRMLWGNHYREFYGKDVNAQVVLLDTLMGGVSPLKRGGGQQSKSLRLEDKNGKQFVMRALKKSTTRFLQANAFQEVYIGNALDGTVIDKILFDFYTTSHPYTPFAIGGLSDAVDVAHTNPKLFYVPKQEALGVFNDEFGDELYMIEEHVGKTQIETKSFGKPDKILSTADILQKIHKSGKTIVDEPSYIRARIFDMLLGDWDRHEDQWRWGEYKNNDGTKYYKPIPRDRDQAFSRYDGVLISVLTRIIPGLRKMQTFGDDLRSVKWFASSPYHLDITLINSSDWAEWEKQTKYIQGNITDSIIEKAFEAIPNEIRGETIEDIKSKLKGRRGNLLKITKEYYDYLNRFEVVTGTQKDDQFKITRLPDGKTSIQIQRKDLAILKRTFSQDITKEIWIYGLDGNDTFTVEGKGDKLIKLKIIGGKKNDTYNFINTEKVKLYDYKSKNNTIVNKRSKKWLVDDYNINNYDHRKVKYNFDQTVPIIAVNPDDGLRIGVLTNHVFHGLQRNPFTQRHTLGASYYTSTSGVNLIYKGEFSNIFHKWNFGLEGLYNSPSYASNFFGFGNETIYDKDLVDFDFNRVRIKRWNAAISLIHRGRDGGAFQIKSLIEYFDVENTEQRFIGSFPESDSVFEEQTYAGAEATYKFENKDNKGFPTLGLDFDFTLGYKTSVGNMTVKNSFGYLLPEIALNHRLTKRGSVILATKIGSKIILGDNFEFYHAAQLGGDNGLRGFRNNRFTGKRSFYQNIDLRIPLGGTRTSIIPIRFGVTGSFDYGRVWIDNDTSGLWHNNVGGALWVSGVGAITANIAYYNSSDGGRMLFVLGLAF
ncbi:metallophosphatase [Flagellimonas sp. CMM7]|uniref:metallophosphatase n=1 Tax=Flagellimonas sp. CMM7 TaxID=2654676 RepID=UPI0013D08D51|nr:metallophosphatase [Flagellimonas sp. CMM7]UII78785.1 metallophosphatase [Flagellimonas sp. CMM7]